jgi:peptide/nickel transport system permease protein
MRLRMLIVRRVLLALPVAIGVVTIIFLALSAMTPIMRVAYYVGSSPTRLNKELMDQAIHDFGLDQPIWVQYVNWLKKIVFLDFGRSYSYEGELGPPVLSLILDSLPPTFELVLYAMPFIIMFSIWLGTKAALNQNKAVDHVARVFGTLGTSLPVFVVSGLFIVLTLVIQGQNHIQFVPLGTLEYSMQIDVTSRIAHGSFTVYTNMMSIDTLLNGDMTLFLNSIEHLILPVAVLVLTQCAALMRVTRSGLIEELGKPYVVCATAKGLSKKDAVYKHARKNASISVLTILGLLMSNMFVSLVIVERVFERPGFASLLIDSATTMNTPVLLTCAMFVALFFVILNLAVDILYEYIDPRIRL